MLTRTSWQPTGILRRCFSAVAAATFCFGCAPSVAQRTVAVRVIKARSGKPLHGYHVWLQFTVHGPRNWQRVMRETGPDGVATFQLEEPLPDTILVSLGVGDAACSGQANLTIRELQTQGAAIGKECGLSAAAEHLSAKPGEIVLFVRPMPLWARILAPLERE
jgi:hypothetical protein